MQVIIFATKNSLIAINIIAQFEQKLFVKLVPYISRIEECNHELKPLEYGIMTKQVNL